MRPTLVLAVLCLALARPLSAQDPPQAEPVPHELAAPEAVVERVSSPIRVDGVLDEPAWAAATPITQFTQLDPEEGEPASQPTDIRFLYDDQALYIGAALRDTGDVRARLGRRDMGMSASDWLTVIIDSYHDHRTAFGFEINPAGVRRDQTRAPTGEDDSWDPVWQAETSVTGDGWVAEIRIPFSQLRFSGGADTWGLQVERQIARRQEFSVWSFTPRDQRGGPPRYGHLTGLEGLETGKRLEVLPYAVSRAEYVDPGPNPFRTDEEYAIDGGVDVKYRVTSNLTLDATINPDFGQVELDPAVVNLTAFETFFAEKRPFFVEGAEIFRFGADGTNNVFYSRRIGRAPSVLPGTPERDVPDATRILGAAKLSGRTAGGWSIGVLDALTAEETSRFLDVDGNEAEMVSEPMTNYFVTRVRRDLREGWSTVGGFFGAVHRDLESDALEAGLRSAAYSGGVDWVHQWDERTWTLDGFLSGTHVAGSTDAIAAAQRLPYHYFQRPDADHLDYDSTRTGLGGWAGALAVSKRVGRHWVWGGGLNTISPGYDVGDLGFQRRADRIDAQVNGSYQENRPGSVFRSWALFGTVLVEHNYGFENISNRIFPGAFFQLLNYWNGNVNLTISLPGTVDDRLTRGGPAARRPGYVTGFARLGSDPRQPLVGNVGGGHQRDDAGGWFTNVWTQLEIKPQPHWELSLGPSYHREHGVAQYLFSSPDPDATATFGRRYVFAPIDQTIFSLDTRLNYTFTPDLSLQVYAQPFIAAIDLGAPTRLVAAGTFDFEPHDGTLPDLDFNIRSLRGNAVLRWEWRPGSTLYVAWQQNRARDAELGTFDFDRDVRAVFDARSDNVFLVKVNYWLNP